MSKIDATVLKDGQLAIATFEQSGTLISGASPIDTTCLVQTEDGVQQCVKTFPLGEGGGGGGGGADTSLSNLTAAGKEVAGTMSMPSSVQDEMSTSGSSGSQYTAPADGWFQVATLSGSSDIISLTSPAIASTIRADGSSWSFYNSLQVAKGTVMTIYTQSGNFNAIRRLYFVYAKGSEPQQ